MTPRPAIGARWHDRSDWFRDRQQLGAVRDVILERLADDHSQEECRYLMRLWWHLIMTYCEVRHEELQAHVSPKKMARLDALFDAVAAGDFEAIDSWVRAACSELPPVASRWAEESPERPG